MVCHHIGQSSGSSTQKPNYGQVPDFNWKQFALEGEPSALIAVFYLGRNAGTRIVRWTTIRNYSTSALRRKERQSAANHLRASLRPVESAFVADRNRTLVIRPSAAMRVPPPQ